ncbi:hypothetical protein [Clostridium tarantellae]|uniref:Uncharacterized protein n=1 Tax=Clostridium tarantellae TaxID=39493 RepID=A0A6I1MMK7_9CLOT|nr:hypothetical protein [Clostridium tarantellae]MPQ43357.1 hypothetical protein [Clostridium tarantellae]
MKYIGPFFRMNSLSTKEIESQLLYLSREAIKHIVLESRCGITINSKILKNIEFTKEELASFRGTTPLLCVYKKAKPNIYSSKYYKSWDDTTFKKDIPILSNALMTSSLIYLTRYYDSFTSLDDQLNEISNLYKSLSKIQLEFYYNYLRNNEGFFIDKKNLESIHQGELNLSEKNSKFNLVDQAFMMISYYCYAKNCKEDEDSKSYEKFAFEILQMFLEIKESIYLLSLNDCCKICFCLNVMFNLSKDENCKILLIDLCDYINSKYYESANSISDLETTGLLAMNLMLAYENLNISLFKDSFTDIIDLFINMYDDERGILSKSLNKKEIKYSSIEIILYILNMILYYKYIDSSKNIADIIFKVYKQYIVNSGLITGFPEPPNLDSYERYINSSLKSSDLIEEAMFRMPNCNSPELTGLASIFMKNVIYSRKKEVFSSNKNTFDSNINFLLFFIINYLLQSDYINNMFSNIKPAYNKKSINTKKTSSKIDNNEDMVSDSIDISLNDAILDVELEKTKNNEDLLINFNNNENDFNIDEFFLKSP